MLPHPSLCATPLTMCHTLTINLYLVLIIIMTKFTYTCHIIDVHVHVHVVVFCTCNNLNVTFLIRWVCFCHVPKFCESLQKFDTTYVFGRTLLSSVFLTLRRQLMERFTSEQDKMVPDKRNLILNHFPRYSI